MSNLIQGKYADAHDQKRERSGYIMYAALLLSPTRLSAVEQRPKDRTTASEDQRPCYYSFSAPTQIGSFDSNIRSSTRPLKSLERGCA